MQNRKAFRSLLSVILLLAFIWMFFLFTQALLKENSNSNSLMVPDDATFAMRFDGKEIAEHTLFSIFLESKDKDLLKLMQESISNKINKDGKWKNYGIDYLSDIVVFEIPYKGKPVQGLLVNVTNETLFRKNIKSIGRISACKNGVGVIFTTDNQTKKLSESELKSLANKIISKNQTPLKSRFKENHGSGKFVETYSNGSFDGKTSLFSQSNLLFELQGQSLVISGDFQMNAGSNQVINKTIKPKGLHFSSTLIPSVVNDSLNNFLTQFSLKIPTIDQISMNFMGTRVINHSSGFFIVPQMELFVNCKSEISIKQILSSPELTSYFDYKMNESSINFQKETLYFSQISPTSFYIGITKNPQIETNKSHLLIKIEGDLKPLTHIEGGGLMTSFLEMLPIYKASKNLSAHAKSLNMNLSLAGKNKAQLKGNLAFSEGYYPMNELVKFLLMGQLIQ